MRASFSNNSSIETVRDLECVVVVAAVVLKPIFYAVFPVVKNIKFFIGNGGINPVICRTVVVSFEIQRNLSPFFRLNGKL